MNEKNATGEESSQMDELRHNAEQRVRDKNATTVATVSEADVRALLHELQVHQIELEMQHEELQRAHTMLESRAVELARTVEQLHEEVQQRVESEASLQRERQTLMDLLEAGDHERRLLGYEIHDGLAQHLAAATMHLQAAENIRTQDPVRAAEAYNAGMALVGEGLKEARRLISNVRPPILDEEGVTAAIAHLVQDQRCPSMPEIDFHSGGKLPRLSPVVENAVYRIAQEGLTNAIKYARTKRVRISLIQQGNQAVRIEIRDWGVGFDPATVKDGCFGLRGIRERTRLLGGSAVVESEAGQGTRIVVDLPLVLLRSTDR